MQLITVAENLNACFELLKCLSKSFSRFEISHIYNGEENLTVLASDLALNSSFFTEARCQI